MDFIVFAIVLIVLVWLLIRWHLRAIVRLAYKIPSNRWHTFFGWGKILNSKTQIQYYYNYAAKYGPNSVVWFGPVPSFLTSDPNTIKTIFLSKNCINKPAIVIDGMSKVVGAGLISQKEPHWSRIRKLMNKSFSTLNLVSFFPVFHKQINIMIDEINENIEERKHVNIKDLFEQLTMKNAIRTILKRDLDSSDFNIVSMTDYLNSIMEYVTSACTEVFCKLDFIRKLYKYSRFRHAAEGQALLNKLIDESKDIIINGDMSHSKEFPKVKSILDYALNGIEANVLTMNDLHGEMTQFFAASYDTSSKALYMIIIMLAMHSEYQERAYEEIASVLGEHNNDDLTIEQLNQLTYLEMIMNETMRVAPLIPMVVREIGQGDLVIHNDLTLPAGLCVAIDIFRLHRRKDLWGENAELFNPDHFLPSNLATLHPYSFIPFTKGLRYCIGQKYATLFIKMTLSKLIKRYKFSTDFKYENLRFHNYTVLKLVENPHVDVKRR